MGNLRTKITMARTNCYIGSFDLLDVFFLLDGQKAFMFSFESQLLSAFILTQLPFMAPEVLRKVLKAGSSNLRKLGHEIMGYLDESLYKKCKVTIELFQKLRDKVESENLQLM